MIRFFLGLSIILFLNAQDNPADSLAVDSLRADSLSADSVKVVEVQFSPTSYFSEYSVSRKNEQGEQITIYRGKAKIIYQDMKIEAHQIIMNFETNELVATPKIDTLENGEIEIIGPPTYTQAGGEPMIGEKMIYNFEKKRGRVFDGRTKVQTAKYQGEYIKKFGKKTMLIRDGMFTTCLADSPSYWIHANKIRMIHGDRVFTGPLYMTIYDVPFPIPLPFGVFSMEKGRKSGLIIPSFYSGTTRGRGLQGLGFYWAISNKMEAKILTDFYENTGFKYDWSFRFKERYSYDGSFKGHYEPKDQVTGEAKPRYGFSFNYNQTVDPSLSINGSGNFESSQTNTQNNANFQELSNQRLNSNLSISKRWDNGASLTTNANHSKNLLTEQESYTFPSMSFSVRSFALFGEAADPLNKTWYEKINMNYSSRLLNNWQNTVAQDTLGNYYQSDDKARFGVEHSISLSAPFKLFKYITLSPRVGIKETWVTKTREVDQSSTDTLIVREKDGFAALHTFSTGVGLSTNLYGLFEPNIGSLKALRHKVAPSVNFNYTPDFSDDAFGYTEDVNQAKYENSFVRTRRDGTKFVDRFALSAFSTTPTNESLNASFSLKNTFSGKFIDAAEKEEKVDLFDLSSSASIDFLKDSLQWSDLRTNFSFPFIKAVSFSGNMTHSLYKLTEAGSRRNDFVDLIPILKNFNFSLGYNLKDTDLYGENEDTKESNVDAAKEKSAEEIKEEKLKKFRDSTIPWTLGFSSSYSYNRFSISEKQRWTGNINSTIDLTEKWHISYNTSLDLMTLELQYQNYTISRDLECWQFNFTYSPNSYNSYYLLTINISDVMLQDIEYKRHSRNLPVY